MAGGDPARLSSDLLSRQLRRGADVHLPDQHGVPAVRRVARGDARGGGADRHTDRARAIRPGPRVGADRSPVPDGRGLARGDLPGGHALAHHFQPRGDRADPGAAVPGAHPVGILARLAHRELGCVGWSGRRDRFGRLHLSRRASAAGGDGAPMPCRARVRPPARRCIRSRANTRQIGLAARHRRRRRDRVVDRRAAGLELRSTSRPTPAPQQPDRSRPRRRGSRHSRPERAGDSRHVQRPGRPRSAQQRARHARVRPAHRRALPDRRRFRRCGAGNGRCSAGCCWRAW